MLLCQVFGKNYDALLKARFISESEDKVVVAGISTRRLNLEQSCPVVLKNARRLPRRLVLGHEMQISAGASVPINAFLHDVSEAGLGVVSSEFIEVGSQLNVKLNLNGREIRITCSCIHCSDIGTGMFRCGFAVIAIDRVCEKIWHQFIADPFDAGQVA